MQAELIEQLLEKLGSSNIKETMGGWVQASCPFAPHSDKHKNRQDAHPSFGVSIKAESEGRSGYRCFTCNAKGTLSDLIMRLQYLAAQEGHDTNGLSELLVWVQANDKYTPPEPPTLKERLEAAAYKPRRAVEIGGIKLSESMATKVVRQPEKEESYVPEETLTALPALNAEAYEYLNRERGISPVLINACEFRWHPRARRIAIPIRDCKGRLVGLSGRAIDPKAKPKFLHSEGFLRDRYLYGEHRLTEGGRGTGIIVEGFFDAIHLWQLGYDAVAILGTYLSRFQLEKLVRFFGDIVILPDGDKAGLDGADHMRNEIAQRMPVRIAPIPAGRDPDELSALDLAEALGDIRK
jgi:hypothetical protein